MCITSTSTSTSSSAQRRLLRIAHLNMPTPTTTTNCARISPEEQHGEKPDRSIKSTDDVVVCEADTVAKSQATSSMVPKLEHTSSMSVKTQEESLLLQAQFKSGIFLKETRPP